MNKILEDLKMEIEGINRTQTEGILEVKNLVKQAETTETLFTDRIEEMEDRVSGTEDMNDKIDTLVKENVSLTNS